MQRYIIKRFLLMIPTLLGVAVFIFLLMRVIPGDIVELRLTSEGEAFPGTVYVNTTPSHRRG